MFVIPGKIPIRIQPLFWIVVFLIGWINSMTLLGTMIWVVVITFSVLFHEFGHALSAVFFGQKAEIELVGFGGLTKRQGIPLKLWQEFIIVLNGPLAGFFLFFLAYQANAWFGNPHSLTVGHYALEVAMYINLVWTVLNLVPVLPLDGAQLLRIALESFLGLKGIRLAALLSLVFAVIISLASFFFQFLLAGAFFLLMAFESYRAWTTLRGMTELDNNASLQTLLRQAEEAFQQGRKEEALSLFLSLREQAGQGVIFMVATQYAARIYADKNLLQEAYDLLFPVQKQLEPEYMTLLIHVAFRLKKWEETIKLGERVFKENPTPDLALINALSYAALGQVRPSLGWLNGAVQAGLRDIPHAIKNREFDPIRLSPEFQRFIQVHT